MDERAESYGPPGAFSIDRRNMEAAMPGAPFLSTGAGSGARKSRQINRTGGLSACA